MEPERRPDACPATPVVFGSCVAHEELLRRVMALAPCELTRTEMDIMVTLDAVGPLAMTPLSESVGVSREQASRAGKALVERGLVRRERGRANKRVVTVRLSEEGAVFLQALKAAALEALDDVLAALTPEERGQLAQAALVGSRLIDKALAPRRDPYALGAPPASS